MTQLAFFAAEEYSGRGNCNVSNAQHFSFFPSFPKVDKLFLVLLAVMMSHCPAGFSPIYMKSVTNRGIFKVFDICNPIVGVYFMSVF